MNTVDTYLYDLSIPFISSLQTTLSEQASFMQLMSVIFDPKYAFLIYSPLAYLFDQQVGKKLILTTVLAEWLNQILKWFLHGERPYWYVHSSGHFDAQQVPIKQFPITCELGPGHPSGHAMVTAAIWYIILDSLVQLRNKQRQSSSSSSAAAAEAASSLAQDAKQTNSTATEPKVDASENSSSKSKKTAIGKMIDRIKSSPSPANDEIANKDETRTTTTTTAMTTMVETQATASSSSFKLQLAVWTVYALLLVTVSVSRVFLGCHFPHQCLAGATLGLLLAQTVSKLESKPVHFIGASLFLFSTAFGTFGLLQALGFDPSWTIKLATTHCVKREYIHLDTAPFFSVMRYCGFALGTGLALLFPLRQYTRQLMPNLESSADKDSRGARNFSWLSVKLVMALLMARLVDNLGLFVSHSSLPIFYSAAFFAYTLFSFAFINL